MSTTTHLTLTLVEQSQAQKEVTLNTALTAIDAILNTGAKSRAAATPPGSPSAGDVYIVAAGPTGAWSGQAGNVAYYAQAWQFLAPNEGMTLWVNDEDLLYTYNGASWVASVGSGGSGISALTGDVTASGNGTVSATIAANAVTYAKMQQASADTLLGNPTGGTANVGEITLGAGLAFSGTTLGLDSAAFLNGGTVISPAISAAQNDWNPTGLSTANVIRVSASAYVDITGLQGGSEGRALIVENGGSFPVRLVAASSGSSSANRFGFPNNVFLAPGEAMAVVYDGAASLWRLVGRNSNEDSACFGGGTDGNVTISSGITRLTRDMHYRNLTISGNGTLYTGGYRVFVSELLDLSGAPALAINQTQLASVTINGTNAPSSTGGGGGSTLSGFTVGVPVGSGGGGAGNTGNGSAAGSISSGGLNPTNGGGNGASGAGGTGSSTTGGSAGASIAAQLSQTFPKFQDYFLRLFNAAPSNAYLPVQAGLGAPGGGGGGGDGSNKGGGGGGGGAGGGMIYLSARFIHRGANTNTGIIASIGGNGGNGFTPVTGNCGGGGGGGAGGGGWIYVCYGALTGSAITGAFDASGGTGGNGGAGVGSGTSGNGGDGGYGGRLTLINLTAGSCTETVGSAGTGHSGATGGAGNVLHADL